jgi:lipid A 3-O-deacylase
LIHRTQRTAGICAIVLGLSLGASFLSAQTIAPPAAESSPFSSTNGHLPWNIGAILQGGKGVTDNRDGFTFLMAGIHAGKILTRNVGPGPLHGNFEYAVEFFPFWQSYTPKFQRVSCTEPPNSLIITCSPPYTVGGTFTGISLTPVIFRWNFTHSHKWVPWAQGAGGVLWTNHKYPAFGGPPYNIPNDGPNADASVWNFTPQGGIGLRYFINPRRSIDLGANAVHISSASLGDRNPGVNASVQFSVGYSWWK